MEFAFTDNGFSLFNPGAFKGLLGSLLLTIVQFLCAIVYFLENAFWILIRGIKLKDGSYTNIVNGLIFNNGALADNQINKITGIIILIAIALVIVAAVVAVIKSQFSTKEEDKSPKIVIMGVVKAILLMVIFPLIIYALLLVTNVLTDTICNYAQFDNDPRNSLANQIFYMFMAPNGSRTCIDLNGNKLFSFTLEELDATGVMGGNPWEKLKALGFVNGYNADGLFGYDYLLAIITLIVLIFALFKSVLLMVRRIFDIVVLYVIAPLPIACYPSDEGKRFDIWKDLMSSKIVASFGLALTFVMYTILLAVIYDTFSTWSTDLGSSFRNLNLAISNGKIDTGTLLTVVYLFILISGALSIPTMYSLLATLVSSQAGMVAHHDLQNMSNDMAYFQRGGHMALRGAFAGAGLMLGAVTTAAFGSRDIRYLNAMRQRNNGGGNGGNGGAPTPIRDALYNFGSYGLLGGALVNGAHAIGAHRSGRLNERATNLRNSAIDNYDNKTHLASINAQLERMHYSPVGYRDVLQSETDRRGEARADNIARTRRGGV